jgi:hypothetical protein
MWWDWTQISLVDSVLFSVLSILILYVVGFGVLGVICRLAKKTEPFSNFDYLQKFNFRVFAGFGFVLFFSVLFSIFSFPYMLTVVAIILVALIGLWFSTSSKRRKRLIFSLRNHLSIILVFTVLLVVLCFSSALITGFYSSTNDDAAFHTLLTRIILDNPNALLTRSAQPYAHFNLNYPTGAHVLCTFLSTALSVSIQKIVIMVSAFLPALIALAIYSTLKCLFERKFIAILGLVIAAFFTIGISWLPISWGGLPLLTSLYISISGMGLIFVFLLKEKVTPLTASLIGLIFFVATQTYPVALLLIFLWFMLILGFKIVLKVPSWRKQLPKVDAWKKNLSTIIAFFVPLFLAVPYLYFIISHYFTAKYITTVSISPASNVYAEVVGPRVNFNWLLDIPGLSVFFSEYSYLFALVPVALFFTIILLVPQVKSRLASVFQINKFGVTLLVVYVFMLILMAYLTLTIDLPIKFLLSFMNSERVWQHLFIVGTILTSSVLFCVLYFLYLPLKRLFLREGRKIGKFSLNKVAATFLAALIVLSSLLLLVPTFEQQRHEYALAEAQLNTYSSLGADDLSLMNWISDNVPKTDVILISMSDSGQYVTSITQRLTISRYSNLQNYTDLMMILTANASDLHAVPLLTQYNISYIYIGSNATMYSIQDPPYRHFNATQFLSTPYFSVVKQVGDAWLFSFNSSAATAAYNDASPLPAFIDSWRYPTFIDILPSEGGHTNPPSGIYYGWGVQTVYAYPDEGYVLDHWMIGDVCLCGPENPVRVNYWYWNLTAVFVKK